MKWYALMLSCSFVFITQTLHAQSSSPNPAMQPPAYGSAPNTATFNRFGNYGVSYFNGLPEISIPLYEIQAGNIKIPVSIDYHASGNKVTDIASWVGLGWSLSYGGQVSRTVLGLADESSAGYLRNPLRTSVNPYVDDDLLYINDVYTHARDAEPDIFHYAIPGKAGKFFLDRTNSFKPAMIPYSPVAITHNFNSTTGNLFFEAADEKGSRFFFGQSVKETTSGSNGGASFYMTSAWMLEKIVSADTRDTVAYSYTVQSSVANEDYSEAWGVDDNRNVVAIDNDANIPGSNFLPSSMSFLTSTNSSSSTSEQLPSQISFKNGSILFTLSATGREDFSAGPLQAKSLKSIQVRALNYTTGVQEVLKTITFYQSYFISGTDVYSKRLKLDSVKIFDKAGTGIETYRFEYNNTYALPARNSKARDYWGYFNGKNNNTLIPQMNILYATGVPPTASNITIGSNVASGREPDTLRIQAAMLKRIYYPTGGYTDLEYENNRYLESITTGFGAGLRIKRMRSYSLYSNIPVEKNFRYGLGENGYGRKNFTLSDYYFVASQTHRYYHNFSGGIMLAITKTRRTFMSAPNIEIVPFDGATVVYPVVTEYYDSAGLGGKTVYTFTDRTDAMNLTAMARPVKSSYFYARGQLLNKSVYKSTPAGYQLIQTEDNQYFAFPEKNYNTVGLVANKSTVNEGVVDNGVILASSATQPNDLYSFQYAYYSITSSDNLLTGTVVKTYDNNDPSRYFTRTERYEYGNLQHMQPTRRYTVSSNNDTIIIKSRYPADYLSGATTGNTTLDLMISRNIKNIPVEEVRQKIAPGGSLQTIGAELNLFRLANSNKDIVPDVHKKLAINRPVADYVPAAITSGNITYDSRFTDLTRFNVYSPAGKLAQYISRTGPPISILWDYKDAEVVAEAVNATAAEIAYTSFETDRKGNFTYTGVVTTDTTSPTGTKSYNLGQASGSIISPALTSATVYKLSYWTKNTTPLTISGTVTGYPLKGLSYNGYTYYEHKVTGVTSITITGSGQLDELRLCPFNAVMTTYCYAPLRGLTGSCDATGNLKFYEYDNYNRLKLVREFSNIVKTASYNYKQ